MATGFQIFVSHSAKDSAFANATVAKLESQGLRCWIAPRDIIPGKEWGASIIEGIESCKLFLIILSGNSVMSQQVLRELERAVAKNLVIVPVRIEDVALQGSMEYFLSAVHWLDAIDAPTEARLEELSRKIQTILDTTSPKIDTKPALQSKRPLNSGRYLSTSTLGGATTAATRLEFHSSQFLRAPFLLLRAKTFETWLSWDQAIDDKDIYKIEGYQIEPGDAEETCTIEALHVTKRIFKFNSSLETRNAELIREFNRHASHADFSDVQRAASLLGAARLIDLLDLRAVTNPDIAPYDGVEYWSQGPFVTYKGKTAEGTRAFFISVHDGVLVDDWRILDTIENHAIDVGSWHNNRPVLAAIRIMYRLRTEGERIQLETCG